MMPFSEACERNKGPILEVLRRVFADRSHVLEIGSGTGQHAVHFAAHLEHVTWHPTERLSALPELTAPASTPIDDPAVICGLPAELAACKAEVSAAWVLVVGLNESTTILRSVEKGWVNACREVQRRQG